MSDELHFPLAQARELEPYLPPRPSHPTPTTATAPLDAAPRVSKPFVTLTFATSLDSALSLAPGTRTALSGPQSKAMTHYLRSRHAAICVGVGTAEADDPGLNCRLALDKDEETAAGRRQHQPRPIVIDPRARWAVSEDSKVMQLAREQRGLAPFIITAVADPPKEQIAVLKRHGGKYIFVHSRDSDQESATDPSRDVETTARRSQLRWEDIVEVIGHEGLDSVMIEGGGQVINSLLETSQNVLVDSVIVTIAPTWLGKGGVVVSPERTGGSGDSKPAARLKDVKWIPLGEDIVLCGTIQR